jgi:hypothetical protein
MHKSIHVKGPYQVRETAQGTLYIHPEGEPDCFRFSTLISSHKTVKQATEAILELSLFDVKKNNISVGLPMDMAVSTEN